MSYTEFYSNVQFDPSKITWKEIFSEFRHKHSKKDMEYAMLAGSSLDRTTEATMLQHWNKPWLFWRILIGGVILIAFCIAVSTFPAPPFTYYSITPLLTTKVRKVALSVRM